MKIDFFTILYVIFFIWIIIEIFIAKWLFQGKPEKSIIKKYPQKIMFLAQLPFGGSWKKHIESQDVKLFENYQRRIRIFFLSIAIPPYLFFTVLYFYI